MHLLSYCFPIDHGAAPNPFHGFCTLTICKPAIRRVPQLEECIASVSSENVDGNFTPPKKNARTVEKE